MSNATKNRNARKKASKRRKLEEQRMEDAAFIELEMEAPLRIHKHVMGRKGVNINKLCTEYPNIHLEFIENKIKIEGPPGQVKKAREQLDGIVKDYIKRLAFIDIIVKPVHYREIIGPDRVNIDRLEELHNIMISIDEKDSPNRIRIEGSIEGVRKAAKVLDEHMEKLDKKLDVENVKAQLLERQLSSFLAEVRARDDHRSVVGDKVQGMSNCPFYPMVADPCQSQNKRRRKLDTITGSAQSRHQRVHDEYVKKMAAILPTTDGMLPLFVQCTPRNNEQIRLQQQESSLRTIVQKYGPLKNVMQPTAFNMRLMKKKSILSPWASFTDAESWPPVKNIVAGKLCAALFDGTYYRAKILSAEEGGVIVEYLDYGTQWFSNVDDLRQLPDNIEHLGQRPIFRKAETETTRPLAQRSSLSSQVYSAGQNKIVRSVAPSSETKVIHGDLKITRKHMPANAATEIPSKEMTLCPITGKLLDQIDTLTDDAGLQQLLAAQENGQPLLMPGEDGTICQMARKCVNDDGGTINLDSVVADGIQNMATDENGNPTDQTMYVIKQNTSELNNQPLLVTDDDGTICQTSTVVTAQQFYDKEPVNTVADTADIFCEPLDLSMKRTTSASTDTGFCNGSFSLDITSQYSCTPKQTRTRNPSASQTVVDSAISLSMSTHTTEKQHCVVEPMVEVPVTSPAIITLETTAPQEVMAPQRTLTSVDWNFA